MTIRRTPDGIGIYNPTRRKTGIIAFMIVWLAGWSVGEYFALDQILRSGSPLAVDLFLLFWVCGWTFGGLLVFSVLAWQLFGVEKLFLIDGGGLVTERGIGPFTLRKVYPVEGISDVGFAEPREGNAADGLFSRGTVRFISDGKARGFGIELDREEAEQVVELTRRFVDRHRNPASTGDGSTVPA